MSWVAVGTTVVSVAGSAYGASQSASATKKAGQLAQQGADRATQAQLDMYNQNREDFSPFLRPSGRAMATLQSALYGGSFGYDNPNAVALTADELAAENDAARGPDPMLDLTPEQREQVLTGGLFPEGYKERPMVNAYDPSKKWYRGADGKLTNAAPQLQATWNPQESEGFKYTKIHTLADLGRQLRMMGRGSGTVAANATGRTLGDLNAANEQQQYSRLTDVIKTGQGAAGTITGAGSSMAGNVGNIAMNNAGTQAGLTQQNGQTMANLYSGIGPTLSNAYSNYQMGKFLNK